jgi:hypothetical protein
MSLLRYFVRPLMAVPGSPGVFFLAQREPRFVGFSKRAGFVVEQQGNGRSLRVWFRISNSTHDVEIRNVKSAKIELCVIRRFSLKKKFRRFSRTGDLN